MPTRCNRGFYFRSYCLLNMFRASLRPQLRVMCPVCRMLQHPANRTHNPQLHTRPETWKTTTRNTTGSNHCIILLSSWWWAYCSILQTGAHNPQLHTRPTTCKPKRQVPRAATICITLELLMMGIMVPETCWANSKFCYKKPICCI